MAHAQATRLQATRLKAPETAVRWERRTGRGSKTASGLAGKKSLGNVMGGNLVSLAFATEKGVPKARAARLFDRIASTSPLAAGKLRAELIPDSSWKRAGKTLGPQASQTMARLERILSFAEHIWDNESAAIRWLNRPHLELRGATPISLLRTEAGGRAVESVLAALEYGFPV